MSTLGWDFKLGTSAREHENVEGKSGEMRRKETKANIFAMMMLIKFQFDRESFAPSMAFSFNLLPNKNFSIKTGAALTACIVRINFFFCSSLSSVDTAVMILVCQPSKA